MNHQANLAQSKIFFQVLSSYMLISILFMPSWLRNQRTYADLVLIKHHINLYYYRISLGAL